MGRTAKAWWNKAKDGWYVELDGKQKRLAKGKEKKAEALRVMRRLLADRDQGKRATSILTQDVFALFLRDVEASVERGERKEITFEGYDRWLGHAEESIGRIPATRLLPKDVTAWLNSKTGWNVTSRFNAITAVKAAFRWARREGHIDANPIAEMERPTPNRRKTTVGGRAIDRLRAGPGAARKKYERARPDQAFSDLLLALRDSGCRPGEVAGVTAAMVDLAAGVWKLPNKTEHATGEAVRVVYLTPALLELSRRLAAEHPEGPIFRNSRGNRWLRNAIVNRFKRLRDKGALGPGEVPYSCRHGFATDALVAGVPIATVAELMGHKGITMIARVYGHLGERAEHMKEAARKARPEE